MNRHYRNWIIALVSFAAPAVIGPAGGPVLAAEQNPTCTSAIVIAQTKQAECTRFCRRWAKIGGKAVCVGGWETRCTGGGGVRG